MSELTAPKPKPKPTDDRFPPAALAWTVRFLSLLAAVITGYLAWISLTGQSPAGCGRGDACAEVLDSRWSTVLGVPASGLAWVLWLTAVVLSLFIGSFSPPNLRRMAWVGLFCLTTAATAAAAWFVWLQLAWTEQICHYCLAAHSCALLTWIALLLARPIQDRSIAGLIGLALGGMIPLIQVGFPPAPRYVVQTIPDRGESDPLLVNGLDLFPAEKADSLPPRYVTMLGGGAKVDTASMPHIGRSDAEYVIVKLFDYTCSHCRKLHRELAKVRQEYGERLVIVLAPVAMQDKRGDLAKLALIVWTLKPERFAEFDDWLFEPLEPRDYPSARKKAASIVGEEALADAEKNPALGDQLELNDDLLVESTAELVPVLIHQNVVVSERIESAAELRGILEREFGMSPPQNR